MKLVARVFLSAMIWALAWALCAMCVAVIGVRTSPDTGHVPHGLVIVIVTFLGTVTGFSSGMIYAIISRTTSLTTRGRVIAGAVAGGIGIVALMFIGAISNSSAANPLVSNLEQVSLPTLICAIFAALLGASLAALDAKYTVKSKAPAET